jgi:hypothetical protein
LEATKQDNFTKLLTTSKYNYTKQYHLYQQLTTLLRNTAWCTIPQAAQTVGCGLAEVELGALAVG